MNLQSEDIAGIQIITVDEPRIDAAVAIQFRDKMRELTTDSPARVILDLTKVEFLDSSGLGSVVAALKMLGREKTLELCSLSPIVEKVFRLTRLDSIFSIHDNREMALSHTEVS